jgi:hypothetical protein
VKAIALLLMITNAVALIFLVWDHEARLEALEDMEDTDVYQQLKDAGCALDNHESDLYVEATPTALEIVKASGRSFTRFTSQVDGKQWLDVPFAYRPWWDKRTGKQESPR